MLKNEEGITLIELLVTISFIGLIVVTSTLIFTNAVHVGKMSDRRNQALHIAEMVLEDVQTYDFTSLVLSAGMHVYNLSGSFPDFQVHYKVILPDLADDFKWDLDGKPLLLTVEVLVSWHEREILRQVSLTTYRAQKTL